MEFDLRRLEFGQAFGQAMAKLDRGMHKGSKPSTPMDVELFHFNQSRSLGLLAISTNPQGQRLWVYFSTRHDGVYAFNSPESNLCRNLTCDHWQPVPEGANA